MKTLAWLVILIGIAGIAFLCWRAVRLWEARRRSEENRFAAFMNAPKPAADAAPQPAPPPPPPAAGTPQEKLLFDAANKAAEAGEPELALQLYQRLLERFPASDFAPGSRMAIDLHKSRRAKA